VNSNKDLVEKLPEGDRVAAQLTPDGPAFPVARIKTLTIQYDHPTLEKAFVQEFIHGDLTSLYDEACSALTYANNLYGTEAWGVIACPNVRLCEVHVWKDSPNTPGTYVVAIEREYVYN
jgi:hypothetical protein